MTQKRVMVVAQDVYIQRGMREILELEHYEALFAQTPLDIIMQIDLWQPHVLVMEDYAVGLSLLHHIHEAQPRLGYIILTRSSVFENFFPFTPHAKLYSPFVVDELLRQIDQVTANA